MQVYRCGCQSHAFPLARKPLPHFCGGLHVWRTGLKFDGVNIVYLCTMIPQAGWLYGYTHFDLLPFIQLRVYHGHLTPTTMLGVLCEVYMQL